MAYHLAQTIIFEEEAAKFYIAQLILAIEYLHSLNIIYRDLKPENILFGKFNYLKKKKFFWIELDGYIKLADFGLSKENVKDNEVALSLCGSPAYLPPEIVAKKGKLL